RRAEAGIGAALILLDSELRQLGDLRLEAGRRREVGTDRTDWHRLAYFRPSLIALRSRPRLDEVTWPSALYVICVSASFVVSRSTSTLLPSTRSVTSLERLVIGDALKVLMIGWSGMWCGSVVFSPIVISCAGGLVGWASSVWSASSKL